MGALALLPSLARSEDVSAMQGKEKWSTDLDPHGLNNYYYQRIHQRPYSDVQTVSKTTDPVSNDPRVRIFQEGILSISATTVAPARVKVKVGVGVVGNLELTTRRETNARWVFRAENVSEEQNIWDKRGRSVLVPGTVTCQISHRLSLTDYEQAGLTLNVDFDVGVIGGGYANGTSSEKIRSDYIESEDICSIGTVSALTSQREIEDKCIKCLGHVLKTVKQDVEVRFARLSYQVSTPICSEDAQCYRENGDWTVGRCVLVKDSHNSYFSECRAKGSIGAACRGKRSRGLFEYACDKGLACMKVYSSQSFLDYHRYECRDPKNWKFKGPLKNYKRAFLDSAKSDLELLKDALEKYFEEHKSYPKTEQGLQALAETGLNEIPRDPFSPFSGRYLYVSDEGKGYTLLSVGNDGKANTPDDLILRK
jgi:hypothetical protein